MSTFTQQLKRAAIAVIVIGVLAMAFIIRFPPDPLYLCQKILDGGLQQWKLEAHTNVWPNIQGDSARSFAEIEERYLSPPNDHAFSAAYGYVPGLKDDDPRDLIFMYLRQMTRRTWNGDHSATVFAPKRWMVFGPDFWGGSDTGVELPEGGELVDTVELRSRFQRTFEYLRTNERPHWRAIVAEHTRFLDAIDKPQE